MSGIFRDDITGSKDLLLLLLLLLSINTSLRQLEFAILLLCTSEDFSQLCIFLQMDFCDILGNGFTLVWAGRLTDQQV